jgi:enoyl-CoA hydratase/carnithine racemase
VLATALQFAYRIAAYDPLTVQVTKELALRSRAMGLRDCDRLESAYRMLDTWPGPTTRAGTPPLPLTFERPAE